MRKCLKKKLKTKNDNAAADIAQHERNNIKCYTSAFSNNIQI